MILKRKKTKMGCLTKRHPSKSACRFNLTTTVYECANCDGCKLKEKGNGSCGSKKPLKEHHYVLYVSKRFAKQHEAKEKKKSSDERSIQTEGTFVFAKGDIIFRRFLTSGKKSKSRIITPELDN